MFVGVVALFLSTPQDRTPHPLCGVDNGVATTPTNIIRVLVKGWTTLCA